MQKGGLELWVDPKISSFSDSTTCFLVFWTNPATFCRGFLVIKRQGDPNGFHGQPCRPRLSIRLNGQILRRPPGRRRFRLWRHALAGAKDCQQGRADWIQLGMRKLLHLRRGVDSVGASTALILDLGKFHF